MVLKVNNLQETVKKTRKPKKGDQNQVPRGKENVVALGVEVIQRENEPGCFQGAVGKVMQHGQYC